MKRIALVRLVVTAVLFAGWIGYLVYLAFTANRPVVLSRPQVLVAEVVVVAEVSDPKAPVVVKEVHTTKADLKAGDKLEVVNLEKTKDWAGPGLYILPLHRTGQQGQYAVVETPPSPGYTEPGPPRVYRATEETRAQLRQIREE